MRAVVQRVDSASVRVEGELAGAIGPGLCVLVGVGRDDSTETAQRLADKLWKLRVFSDDDGKMNRSVAAVGGAMLVVSQFTLYGDASKGNRPSYVDAAPPELATDLIDVVVERLRSHGATVACGVFGADMDVELLNQGPVTLVLEM